MMQAMDRAHRIGQKKEVQVFRFCVESSIEEKVIEKAYKKLRLDALVIQQGRLTDNTKGVNKEDLLSMVRYGAEKVFSSEVCAFRFCIIAPETQLLCHALCPKYLQSESQPLPWIRSEKSNSAYSSQHWASRYQLNATFQAVHAFERLSDTNKQNPCQFGSPYKWEESAPQWSWLWSFRGCR